VNGGLVGGSIQRTKGRRKTKPVKAVAHQRNCFKKKKGEAAGHKREDVRNRRRCGRKNPEESGSHFTRGGGKKKKRGGRESFGRGKDRVSENWEPPPGDTHARDSENNAAKGALPQDAVGSPRRPVRK